ncbi:MAG: winged helix-turn-helix transcriptional regulator [Dokdonella sp.]|uniref:ArsR/SmtB family transcription factor n=1 Tax=Dokdonella sp. TaxID=2291710 RepID=UPI0025BA612E|nr:metalloregulator ArsR/SmtB family transcription factor [Dokdonella sp.]MBZ0221938.1 metalloregulator ArsR/SmtB family transcription factor [Dokdonella sp.]MCC7255641.1 winged helix-turn-helix transcriptional regulator [Dokdonella sp.]
MTRNNKPKLSLDLQQMRAHAGDASRLLKTLGNDKRLLILCQLAEGERSVGQLNEHLDLSQPALSQHLAVLRDENLVTTRRDGQTIHYALAEGPAARVIQLLHEIYCGKRPRC